MKQQPGADLARVTAIVPVRALEHAKSRLGGVLDPEERAALAAGLTTRTLLALAEVRAAGDVERVLVASADPGALSRALAAGAAPVAAGGHDLVADLRLAREVAIVGGATAVLVVPIDLARVSATAIDDVLAAGRRALDPARPLVVLAPDRAGTGTNTLLVSPPRAIDFAFGPGSRGLHVAAARAAGAVLVELDGPLALDLDTPDDLSAAGDTIATAAVDPGPATTRAPGASAEDRR